MAELLPRDRDPLAPTPARGRAIREIPVTERPRERLAARGAAGLSAAELIGLLWGSGSRGRSAVDLAEDALARHDGLTGLARATEVELDRIAGIGAARSAQLTAAFELGRRLLADWPSGRWAIRAPADVADRLVLQMGRLEREELRVVLLNTKNVVLRVETVYQGNVSASLVRVGELFRDAVRLNAAGLILVHNHPSGDPTAPCKTGGETGCQNAPPRRRPSSTKTAEGPVWNGAGVIAPTRAGPQARCMGRPFLEVAGRPTACPDHANSRIYADRPTRRWSAFHEGRAFRCNPIDGSRRHLMPSTNISRTTTPEHPRHGRPCHSCGDIHEGGGPSIAAGNTFATIEIAKALIRVARGSDSITNAANGAREEAYRAMGARRKRGRRMVTRQPYQPPTAKGVFPQPRLALVKRHGPPKPYPYDYQKAKTPVRVVDIVTSRSANLVSGWIDVFAPALIEEYGLHAWPQALILDTLPLKRRRIGVRATTGKIGRMPAGERNGEVFIASDGTRRPAPPALIALEGGKDHISWLHFFGRLDSTVPPVWIVSDIDDAIEKAVGLAFPGAVHYRCHRHLKERINKALAADGVDERLPPKKAAALGITVPEPLPNSRRVRDLDFRGYVEHPLYTLVGYALKTVEGWEAFVAAAEATIPADMPMTRAWIAERDALVRAQVALQIANPTMPRSTGAVEATIKRVGLSIEPRSEYFRNRARLDNLLGLIRLEAVGLANEQRYADVITTRLDQRGARPIDWRASRDLYGATSSIDAMIDESIARIAVAKVAAENAARNARAAVARANAHLPAGQRPPINTGNGNYWNIGGLSVAEIPGIGEQWAEDLNDGVPASQVKASKPVYAWWRCRAHEALGHVHEFRASIVSRTTHRSRCPMCTIKPCPTNNFAFHFPELAREWYQPDNGTAKPEDFLPKAHFEFTWKCSNPDHVTFPQKIYQRAAGVGCPECYDDKRWVNQTQADAARSRTRRRIAREVRRGKARAVVVLPPIPIPLDPPIHSITSIAREFKVNNQTVRNWTRKGGYHTTRIGEGKGAMFMSESELRRLRADRLAMQPGQDE